MDMKQKMNEWLELSSLIPGICSPNKDTQTSSHAVVYVGEQPLVITGPHDDAESVQQAMVLANSAGFQHMVEQAGYTGKLRFVAKVDGHEIPWPEETAALIGKVHGQGAERGPVIALVLGESKEILAIAMCITTDVAQIFDPAAPEMMRSKGEVFARETAHHTH